MLHTDKEQSELASYSVFLVWSLNCTSTNSNVVQNILFTPLQMKKISGKKKTTKKPKKSLEETSWSRQACDRSRIYPGVGSPYKQFERRRRAGRVVSTVQRHNSWHSWHCTSRGVSNFFKFILWLWQTVTNVTLQLTLYFSYKYISFLIFFLY